MQKKWQWNESSIKFTQKQSHSANLIGICKHGTNTFLTSSQDRTVRLWDIRSQSSIKLIRNPVLTQQLSNPATNFQNEIYIGSGPKLYKFDLRQQLIFIQKIQKECKQPHYDVINQIKYSQKYKQVLCCDDEGDIRIYNSDSLDLMYSLQQQHANICNAIQLVYLEGKQFLDKKICVSGGFDSTLIIWNMEEEKPIKKIPMPDIFQKYQIKMENQSYPFIHCLHTFGASVLVGLETGYIMCIPIQQPRKPKFIMRASLTRLTDCKVSSILGKNTLICTAIDDSFSLFDYDQRVNGQPKFLQKYRTICEPIQVQVLGNIILLASVSASLSFYHIKQ